MMEHECTTTYKKFSMKSKVLLTLILIFVLLFTACNNKELPENSSVVSTPFVDDLSVYVLIGEIESSNEYLQNESNNIKVYGKNKDNLDNYTEIKFMYKDKEWISDEVRIFADKEMEREDIRQFNLSFYEDKDIISVIYYEKISSDEIKENILFFDQLSFTQLNPEDINISVQHQSSEEKVVIDETSYNLQTVIKAKIDPDIFDNKTVISKKDDIEVCTLKKDSENNYSNIYVKIGNLSKTIVIMDRKNYEFGGLYFNVLDVNLDGNDELVINFYEKTNDSELTQSVCFVDINTEKEVTLSDLRLENIVGVTYGTDKRTITQEGKEYKVNTCHYTRKVELNKDNFHTVPVKEIILISEEKGITLSVLSDPVSYITENGRPDIFALQYADKVELYNDWSMPKSAPISDNEHTYEPFVDIGFIDLDDDGLDEIIVSMFIGGGTESAEMELHIINGSDLNEIVTLTNQDMSLLLKEYIDSRVYIEDNQVKFDICINDDLHNIYTYSVVRNENATYFSTFGYASVVNYILDSDNNILIGEASVAIGITQFIGHFKASIILADGNVHLSNIQFVLNSDSN
jgi:hypothetical protein